MAARKSKIPLRRSRDMAITRKLFLLAIFAVAQAVFFTSSMFRVQTVEVVGNVHLRDDVIRTQAAVPLDAPLFTVGLKTVANRVQSLHWVREAAVRRYMPGRIQIRVTERTPVLAIANDREADLFPKGWYTVSDDGMVLAPATARGDEKLPRVRVHNRLVVGKPVPATQIATVREILAAIPPHLRKSVEDLHCDAEGGLALTMKLMGDPIEVRLGGSDRSAYKFEVLQALTARLQEEGKPVTYIDLRYPDPAVGHAVSVVPAPAAAPRAQ